MAIDLSNVKLPTLQEFHAELARRGMKPKLMQAIKSDDLQALERDWRLWLQRMGPDTFTREFEWYQEPFWEWGWSHIGAHLKLEGFEASKYLAYLDPLPRGYGKSSSGEWYAIALGAILENELIGYVSRNSSLAVQHLKAIQSRIESSQIGTFYPGLAKPRVGKFGQQIGWRSEMLMADNGFAAIAVGLEEEPRGFKDIDRRVSCWIFDDVDSIDDTPYEVNRKEKLIARSLLPAGTPTTKVLIKQNLIHEGSVISRIFHRKSDLLSYRECPGLVRAFEQGVEIVPDETGERQWKFQNARPTSKYFDMAACQKFLDDSGPVATMAEYQQDFTGDREDRIFSNYDDTIHVITWAEFEQIFKTDKIPDEWHKAQLNDWGRTKSDYHANVTAQVAVSSQNSPLPGFHFLYNLFSYPENTGADDVALRMLESWSPYVTLAANERQSWRQVLETSMSREGLDAHRMTPDQYITARRNIVAPIIAPLARVLIRKLNIRRFCMSHEADHVRKVWQKIYGMPFQGVNPGKWGGTELINLLWKVDRTRPHPFRPDALGYSRMFVIVDKIEPGQLDRVPSDQLEDSELARYHFMNWRRSPAVLNKQGEIERPPLKMFDDFPNALMMLFSGEMLSAAPLTDEERLSAVMPEQSRPENLLARSPHENGLTPALEMEQYVARQFAAQQLRPRRQRFDEDLRPIDSHPGFVPRYGPRR